MLVELLNETLEKISGYKAENSQIIEFLQNVFPNFSIGTLAANATPRTTNVSISNTELPTQENLVVLDSDKLKDLLHTKILEAKFGNIKSLRNWRSVLDTAIKTAFEKGLTIEDLQDKLNINFREGIYNLQGFSPIEGMNYSWQNQDANKSAINAIKLARLLNYELHILFEWREKGIFPMKQGLIHWKP